jgi:hypothetical protein
VRLWAGQRFPAWALRTRRGVPLRVLHPGRPGRGPGPDFRDAIIAPPSGRLLRGDVELHVRASDFVAHGHAADPRYDRVVLHLVFDDDAGEETQLACGRRAPVVALAPWARERAAGLARWLATPRLWREPCHGATARLGSAAVHGALAALGDRRFDARVAVLGREARELGPAEALYRALLEGLGYGGDRAAMAALADRLAWPVLASRLVRAPPERRRAVAETLLLAAAGPPAASQPPHDDNATPAACTGAQGDAPSGGRFFGAAFRGRPANQPARRLAGLAALLARHGALFADEPPLDALLSQEPRALIAAWSVAAGGQLEESGAGRGASALVGRGRAIELLVNAVLPWAAAVALKRGDETDAARARALFALLPRPARYGALAFLEANLRDGRRALPLDARHQQGLLALYKTECTQGGCGRCVLS